MWWSGRSGAQGCFLLWIRPRLLGARTLASQGVVLCCPELTLPYFGAERFSAWDEEMESGHTFDLPGPRVSSEQAPKEMGPID